MSCEGCPYEGHAQIFGRGNRTAKYCFIGSMPNQYDINTNKVFAGSPGNMISAMCHQLNIKDVYYTTITKCNGAKEDFMEAALHCDVLEEIKGCTHLIPLGKDAMEFFPLLQGNITDIQGQPKSYKNGKIMPLVHPSAILKQPSQYNNFAHNFSKLLSLDLDVIIDHYNPTIHHLNTLAEMEEYFKENNKLISFDIEGEEGTGPLCLGHFSPSDPDNVYTIPKKAMQEYLHDKRLGELLSKGYYEWNKGLAQNGKFDIKMIGKWYKQIPRLNEDTILIHRLIDENDRHGLEHLAMKYANAPPWKTDFKNTLTNNDFSSVSEEELELYNARDVYYTYKVWEKIHPLMSEKEKWIYDNILIPSSYTLAKMELKGVLVDREYLEECSHDLLVKMAAILSIIEEIEGKEINPNSSDQVSDLLFKDKGYRDMSHKGSTGETYLLDLYERYKDPTLQLIIEYRIASKFRGTYVEGIIKRLDENGYLHTDYNMYNTDTGRLSSKNPNLQNIPRESGVGLHGHDAPVNIRPAFMGENGWHFMEPDYSSGEARIWALMSQDPQMINIFQNNLPFHEMNCSNMFEIPLQEVTKVQRHASKFITYGEGYGRGVASIAVQINRERRKAGFGDLSVSEVSRLVAKHRSYFQGATKFMHELERQAVTQQYVESIWGQRRKFPLITSDNRHEVCRVARAAPMQNGLCLLTMHSMVKIDEQLPESWGRLVMNIHDSLPCVINPSHAAEACRLIKTIMEDVPFESNIPFPVDINVYKNKWKKDKITVDF